MRGALLLLSVGGLLAAGCGAIDASTAITDCSSVLVEAEQKGATRYARYEYYKASAYLQQAKLKNGYGEYHVARVWAQRAGDLAKEARSTASRRRDLELRRIRGKQKFQQKHSPKRKPIRRKAKPNAKRPIKTAPAKPAAPIKRRQLLPPTMKPTKPKGDEQ